MKLPHPVKDELEYRIQEDRDSMFEPRNLIEKYSEFDIMNRNDWQGVIKNGELCVPTIFDKVIPLNFNSGVVIVAEIMGFSTLWMEKDGKWKQIIEEYATKVSPSSYYGSIILEDDKGEWLFSVKDCKFIFNEPFEVVSKNPYSKLIWGKKVKDEWWFINVESEDPFIVQGDILPLEHQDYAFYMLSNGNLEFLEGDSFVFRKKVAKAGGRIELSNSRNGRTYFVDAFAQVLNP